MSTTIFSKTLFIFVFFFIFFIWFFLNFPFLYWLLSFTIFGNMLFFITLEAFPSLFFFLLPTFFCHMAVLVVIEILWLPVFEIIIGLSNVHRLSSPSICHFCAHLIIMSSFCGFIPLFYWGNCYLLLFKCLWCCNGWVSQYYLDDVGLYVLFQ